MRLFLGGLGAIVLLGALAAIAIYRATEYEPARAPANPAAAQIGANEDRTRVLNPAAPGAPELALRGVAANAQRVGGSGSVPPPVPETRRAAVRTARRDLIAGLGALRDQVARCGATDAGFILELEALDGAVRVQGARVEEPGAASPVALACAQSALGGQIFPAPSIASGRRWEIPFAATSASGLGTGVP
jgi:hypothetical protein